MRLVWRVTCIVLFVLGAAGALGGCTPEQMEAAKKSDATWTGTCDVGEVGWEISYNAKGDKTTFLLWVADGDCDFD